MSAMPIVGGGWSSSRKSKRVAINQIARLHRACNLEFLEPRLYLSSAAYNWQNANIGAGGYVDGVFYDPNNQNVIYARTDVGGLYKSVNDGGNWTQLLNFVGNNTTGSGNNTQYQEFGVLSFAIDPENSNNLYADVGEYSGTNGDVLYSTNAGQTWTATPLSFWVGGNSNGRGDGEEIAVDPNNSKIIFLGSNANGLWESTNAGHSFTQITSFSPTSTTFVLFNSAGGVSNGATQNIFVGIDSTSSGTNLYETTNSGTSWSQVTGSGSLPKGYMPGHAVISGGYIYLGYANALAPNGNFTAGGVYRYQLSSGTWANITPKATNGAFGYNAIAADPNNPNTIVVASFNYYSGPDQMWRTVNANAASPTWYEPYEIEGYGGFNTTRNYTAAPWDAVYGDGVGNWLDDIAVNPFNSNQLIFGGIVMTNNISNNGANTTLTAPNSWYSAVTGIEMTAILGLEAPSQGIGLISALGDDDGFDFSNLNFSPTNAIASNIPGGGLDTMNSIDYGGTNPNVQAVVGSTTDGGAYTTNDGATWTSFASHPGTNGGIAVSANGSTFVWAPSGMGPYYSANDGTNWTPTNLVASVSSITQTGGVPTVVTSTANGFLVGQTVTIAGATPSAYDGTYVISSIVNSTTFTYTDSNVTSSTATPATGTITASLNGTVVSDKVNPNYMYYWTENSTDNAWTLYISSNGGQTFSESAGGPMGTGSVEMIVSPYVAGQIWLATYIGLYESTNFGASFNKIGGYYGISSLALGAPAPGQTVPAIYIYSTPPGDTFEGIYRSDDGGNTWVLLNNVNTQWGGVGILAADPNVFGRVYAGSSGIKIGNPATSLPANWTDADINEPGNPGWATSSTTLSTGTTVNEWNLVGGGAGYSSAPFSISSLSRTGGVATAVTTTASGIQVGQMITISGATNSDYDGTFVVTGLYDTTAGLAAGIGAATEFTFAIAAGTDTASGTITATLDDQFNYAYEAVTGSTTVSAELMSLTNGDNGLGTPQAGVMVRASANPDDAFFEIAQTSAGSLVLEYRTTTGGSVTTQTLNGIPVGSEYLEIVRSGSNFSGYYSSNGTNWTQLGPTVSIAAMPTTANVGLASTASYNPQLTDAVFNNVNVTVDSFPTIATAAAANPSPVTGTSTALSVLGSENGSDTGLIYTWSYTGPSGVTYSGATNGTNAAKNITAIFTQAGSYNFTATITDQNNNSITSSIAVTVNQTPTTVMVSPNNSPVVPAGFSQQFSASANDQFGNAIASQSFTWGISGSGNSISSSGDATMGSTTGSFTVTATDGSAQGMATVIAEDFAVPSGSTLDINLSSAGPVTLSASGANITASQNGLQVTLSGFTGVTVTDTASGDVLNFSGNLSLPFTFVNTGSSTVNVNGGTLIFAANMGGTISIGNLSVATGASAMITAATTNSPTTLSVNTLSIGATGSLDVANNEVLINYGSGPDPISTIAGWIASGYANAAWNGPGIVSSVAQMNAVSFGLGYADAADAGNPANLPSGQIEILYTLFGDANLDGKVNGTDFNLMAGNFNQAVTNGWDKGDFNYNGAVNGNDFVLLSENFNQFAQIAVPGVAATANASTTESTPATASLLTPKIGKKSTRHDRR